MPRMHLWLQMSETELFTSCEPYGSTSSSTHAPAPCTGRPPIIRCYRCVFSFCYPSTTKDFSSFHKLSTQLTFQNGILSSSSNCKSPANFKEACSLSAFIILFLKLGNWTQIQTSAQNKNQWRIASTHALLFCQCGELLWVLNAKFSLNYWDKIIRIKQASCAACPFTVKLDSALTFCLGSLCLFITRLVCNFSFP